MHMNLFNLVEGGDVATTGGRSHHQPMVLHFADLEEQEKKGGEAGFG
ncbi:hypothetical protein A2U01_0063395, partial [Trifolium medium]|nr:hypothetical protein [Trifolium medium]